MLVALEGIDGSGKSSVAAGLFEVLEANGIETAFVPTRGAFPISTVRHDYIGKHLEQLAQLIWPRQGAECHHDLGYEHWLHLVAAYFHGLSQAVLPRLQLEHDVVIVESWSAKFAAKLRLKGLDSGSIDAALGSLTPDRVFLIDTPPALAWAQKRHFSFVELGGQDGFVELGRSSFVEYQSRLRSLLVANAVERGWTVIDNGVSATTQSICAEIITRLGLAGSVRVAS